MKGVRSQMKKFKQFFNEASAKDHVVPKDDDDEAKDYKPRSKGEKEFKDKHKVEKKKHPVADDSVHTGDIKKVKKEEVELEEDHDDKKDDHDSDDYEDDEEESDEVAEAVIDDLENIVKRNDVTVRNHTLFLSIKFYIWCQQCLPAYSTLFKANFVNFIFTKNIFGLSS